MGVSARFWVTLHYYKTNEWNSMAKYKLKNLLKEFHAGKSIASGSIKDVGKYPVFGGNGQRGYTDTYNQGGQYLIIGRQGAYCGNVRYNIGKAFLTEHAIVGQANEGNNAIYLALKLSLMDLGKLQGQSAQPGLSVETLSCISLDIPSKEIQDTIAKIIVTLDKKIALNRQINDNLEAMAKQLYDYWFVQFDFPNEEGKPYKSSGGAMVWNEKLKREIPQGWGTQNLADCLKLKTERVNSKDIKDTDNYTPIEVIPRKQMSLHETVALENAMSGICRYSRRNILLSNRRVYFHKVCIAPFDGLTRDTVLVLEPYNSGNLGYLYETVFADEFILFATKHSYGSEQPVLSWTSAQKFNVLRPSNTIDKKYSEIVDSIIDSVLNNQIEIIKLTKQRDELLPLLMNGQASVNSD